MEKIRKIVYVIYHSYTVKSFYDGISFFGPAHFLCCHYQFGDFQAISFLQQIFSFFLFFFNIKTNNQSFFDSHVKENLSKQAIHPFKLNELDLR